MRKYLKRFGVLTLMASVSFGAFSGKQNMVPVTITQWSTSTDVIGTVLGTSRSADNVAYIECAVLSYYVGSTLSESANCSARTSSGTHKSGYTTDSALINVIKEVTTNSWIHFQVRNSDSKIIRVNIKKGSKYVD